MIARRLIVSSAGLCMGLCIAGSAGANELLRCRAIVPAAERLACYDGLAAAQSAPATVRVPAPAIERPAPAGVAPAPGLGPVPTPESGFGLPARAAAVVERDAIESSIPGAFEGWRPRESFTLANGQVWQIADDSEGAYARRDPKVRIERGRAGGFFLIVEGVAQTPRVRRVK